MNVNLPEVHNVLTNKVDNGICMPPVKAIMGEKFKQHTGHYKCFTTMSNINVYELLAYTMCT
jgi:hypothetical protein